MNLQQIIQAERDVIEQGISIDLETGEVLFDETHLNELGLSKKNKFLAMGKMITEKTKLVAEIKDQAKSMAERKKSLESQIDKLKDWSTFNIGLEDVFEDAFIRVSCAKGSPSLDFSESYEFEKLPTEYISIKPAVFSADKKKMLADLKSGTKLDGVTLVRKPSLRIK
tara:strand:- start:21187 stop:21690 length:504 start_codon:yes stop_codon:yes gene_type:complete